MNFQLKLRKKCRYILVFVNNFFNHSYVEKILFEENKNIFYNKKGNINKTLYYINLLDYKTGFFAQYRLILQFLNFAEKHNYIPLICMSNFAYCSVDKKCNKNVFEYFYCQPSKYGLNDIGKFKKIIYADLYHLKLNKENDVGGYNYNINELKKESMLKKKYIRYNSSTYKKLNYDIQNIIKNKNVLGVHIRGGDFKDKMKDHPVGLEVKDYIENIEEALKMGFDKIFLATDDEIILKDMKNLYKERLLFFKDVLRTDTNVGIHYQIKSRKLDGYKMGYEVIRDMYTLAQCEGLIAGLSQVSMSAIVERYSVNKEYSFLRIIDKGMH